MKEIKKTLFHPLDKYTLHQQLTIGGIGLLVGAVLGYIFHAHFDGVFALHFTDNLLFWQPMAENLLSTSLLFILLAIAGSILYPSISYSKLLALSLFSRFPLYLLTFTNIQNWNYKVGQILFLQAVEPEDISMNTVLLSVIFGILSFLIWIWMLVLLYNGFKALVKTQKNRLILSSILIIIFAEVISRLVFRF